MVKITKADPNHLQTVESLLKKVNLPVEGVKDNFSNFFVVKEEKLILGCAGIEIYENVGLLRSVAIKPSSQKKGIGQKLVKKVEAYALEKGIRSLYLLTDIAEKFFLQLNYLEISRNHTDSRIKESIEFTTLCTSATVMVKEILN